MDRWQKHAHQLAQQHHRAEVGDRCTIDYRNSAVQFVPSGHRRIYVPLGAELAVNWGEHLLIGALVSVNNGSNQSLELRIEERGRTLVNNSFPLSALHGCTCQVRSLPREPIRERASLYSEGAFQGGRYVRRGADLKDDHTNKIVREPR